MDRLGAPYLAFRDAHGRLRTHALDGAARSSTLGRRPEADVSISWDGQVSGVHAELRYLGGEWTVVDDRLSSNGTYVNEDRLDGQRRLHDGDRIRIGRTVLAFRTPGPRADVATTVADAERPALAALSEAQRRVLLGLCRPYRDGESFATPATNREIASELHLSVDAVKGHLREMYGRLGMDDLPRGKKRAKLAEYAFALGLVSRRDLTAERRERGV